VLVYEHVVKMNRKKYLFKLAHDYLEFRLPVSVMFVK